MADPSEILDTAYRRAIGSLNQPFITDQTVLQRIQYLARLMGNRAGVRVILSCCLAKIHDQRVDVRKPYTEIDEPDTFSGRHYDESYITGFINKRNVSMGLRQNRA